LTFRTKTEPQDWPAIAAHLAAHGFALDPAEPPRQFAGGLANLNYLVRLGGAPAVFRRPPAGPLAHGASDMGREARALAALAPCYPLAPQLLYHCEDPGVIGVPFLLVDWRPGLAVGAALPPPLTLADAGWLLTELVGAMAALHALEPTGSALAALGKPTGFAARQLAGWDKRASAAFGADRPAALLALITRLAAALPPDAPARPLHMDLKFDNMLVDPARARATAVIDWDMATLGNPAFDLAVLLSYWVEPADPPGLHPLGAVPSLVPGWPRRADAVAAYAAVAGAVPPDLAWHLTLARLRLATAWMQLYRLWQQGRLSGDRYAGFGCLADAVLAHALERFGEI
jgi:aminoglycoside phosphotransferase (APT) family kinase protein